jgi:hypothetical protein
MPTINNQAGKRYSLSDSFSLRARKYFLGPVFVIFGAFLITRSSGFTIVMGIVFAAIGLMYTALRKIQFDSKYIYIGRKQFEFTQIHKIRWIDVNMYTFPILEFDDHGRKRRYITDSGQAGLLRILLGIIFPALDPLKNLKKFHEFYEASKS